VNGTPIRSSPRWTSPSMPEWNAKRATAPKAPIKTHRTQMAIRRNFDQPAKMEECRSVLICLVLSGNFRGADSTLSPQVIFLPLSPLKDPSPSAAAPQRDASGGASPASPVPRGPRPPPAGANPRHCSLDGGAPRDPTDK